jgi:hypothetical protein
MMPLGNQVQRRLHPIDDQRVACVMAALKAHDALRHLGQPVDEFALAFVAPLGPDHHDVTACCLFFHWKREKRWIKGI